MTSPEELPSEEGDFKNSILVPQNIPVDKKNTFRHFENTVSSITQRSQTAFDISNQLHLQNEDAININSFVYRPQVN